MTFSRHATVAGAAITFIALAPFTPVAPADIQGSWQEIAPNVFKFQYTVSSLPDFDQVRAGLPNCGLYYCVPTSTADLLAYIANHGYPEVTPGPGAWMSPGAYSEVTNLLKDLGQKMDTSATSGTTKGDWYFALVGFPGFGNPILPKSKFTVTAMFADGDYDPRLYQAMKAAIWSNGLVALIHGWYENSSCIQEDRIDHRNGGHCLAVRTVGGFLHKGGGTSYADYGAELYLHDPGFDEGASGSGPCGGAYAPNSQSPATKNGYKLWLHQLWNFNPFTGFCAELTKLDRLHVCAGGSCTDTEFRLVDAYLLISLKSGYTFSSDPEPIFFHLKPIQFASATPSPIVQALGSVAGAASASINADGESILVVAENQLKIFEPLTGGLSVLPEGDYHVANPLSVAVGRRRGVYLIDGPSLVCLNLNGIVPGAAAIVVPPIPPTTVLTDDSADQVVVVSASAHAVARYPWKLDAAPAVINIPPSVPLGPSTKTAIDPTDGAIWFSNGNAIVHRVLTSARGGATAESFVLPGVQTAVQGFDVDDAGRLIVSVGETLREFRHDGAAMIEVLDSPFRGLPGGRIVLITHSRTNYDVATHGTPEWRDEPPPSTAPPVAPCLADLDGDEMVGSADLGMLLGAWGGQGSGVFGDLDGDGLVGPTDLGRLLGNWGPCPPPPEPPIVLSDICTTAPLVSEGSYSFDSTAALTDGPGLPSSCDEGAGLAFGQDLWALYLPSASGVATISTCLDADFDTRLAVYGGFCDSLLLLKCNDDDPSCPSFHSKLAVSVTAGVPIKIRVGGYSSANGQGSLDISLDTVLDADLCANAVPVTEGSYSFDTTAATTDGPALPASCEEGSGLSFGHDTWLRYTPGASGIATVSTCGTADYDTRLAAYLGACDALTLIGCNDDGPGCTGFTSKMTFPVTFGVPVIVRIGGYGSAAGTGTVSISVQ